MKKIRLIKFRGKTFAGRLKCGCLVQDHYGACFIIRYSRGTPEWYQVDPKSVGQYTGLEDSRGTKIWEGDILRLGRRGPLMTVFWDNGRWMGNESMALSATITASTTVIGNTFDNPDLVKP